MTKNIAELLKVLKTITAEDLAILQAHGEQRGRNDSTGWILSLIREIDHENMNNIANGTFSLLTAAELVEAVPKKNKDKAVQMVQKRLNLAPRYARKYVEEAVKKFELANLSGTDLGEDELF